jgi:hypothetical protein
MGLEINDINDLQKLLKRIDLKVQSIEELKALLAVVQQPRDPVTAQVETIKKIGHEVPTAVACTGGVVSFLLVFFGSGFGPVAMVGALAIIWGAVALICVPAILSSMILLGRLQATPAARRDSPPVTDMEKRLSEYITVRKEP